MQTVADDVLRALIDAVPVNVMFADQDFRITYVNQPSLRTLHQIEHLLPVRADQVVGSSIDVFHRHPPHQRRILSDPSSLPVESRIQLGDETMELRVSAVVDPAGARVGTLATWRMVTEELALAEREKQGAEDLKKLIDAIAGHSTTLSSATEELSATSTHMSAATGQMSNSIADIAHSASDAATVGVDAVREAEQTNLVVSRLGDSSAEIGNVIKVITSIAQQTHLLALNATIEAARAGEAGKGFAVVAGEVKELAKETAKATEDITGLIEAIQADTTEAVSAIERIGATVVQINEIQTSIAAAVEEQSAAAGANAQGSSQTREAAADLSRLAARLSELVSQFDR